MKTNPVEIVPCNQAWPSMFEMERAALCTVLGPWFAGEIQHVGSTAVPGLPAKPMIDIMAPVVSLQESLEALAAAALVGYVYYPWRADIMHWLCKPSPSVRTHHLYLVPWGSRTWFERLAFRDALRASPCLSEEYAALKRSLASQFPFDRDAYTASKTPFI